MRDLWPDLETEIVTVRVLVGFFDEDELQLLHSRVLLDTTEADRDFWQRVMRARRTVEALSPLGPSQPPHGFQPSTRAADDYLADVDLRSLLAGQCLVSAEPSWHGLPSGAASHGALTVHMLDGQPVLTDGHHRAVALIAAGHRTAPAVVVERSDHTPDVFCRTSRNPVRPPLVRDFLSDAAIDVRVRPR